MSVYMVMALVALALGGGFFVGRFFFARSLQEQAVRHYRTKYNEQMAELCARYRQERLALIHRYEGLVADVEAELRNIESLAKWDSEKTQKSYVASNQEAIELDEVTA